MKILLPVLLILGMSYQGTGQVTESSYYGTSFYQFNKAVRQKTDDQQGDSLIYPEFPGGDVEFIRYINKKVKYPKKLKKSKINGVVYVSFCINENGDIPKDSIRISRGLHPLLDADVIRVISKMPRWKPGRDKEGNPTRVWFHYPVRFYGIQEK